MNCRSRRKVQYESEFEASVAVAHAERELRAPMKAYRCGNHWHIANLLKELRTGSRRGAAHGKTWCKFCNLPLNRTPYSEHADTKRHRKVIRLRNSG